MEKDINQDKMPVKMANIIQTEIQKDQENRSDESTSDVLHTNLHFPLLPLHIRVLRKVIKIVKNITVEPSIMLFLMAIAMSSVMVQSLAMRKLCLGALNQTDEVCKHLTNYPEVEKEAEKLTSEFIMYKTIMESMPNVILILFIGSWSDKNGRKMLMLLPAVCSCISTGLFALNAHFLTQLDVNYILLACVPGALAGHMLTLMSASFSYMADITDSNSRTIRFSIVQAVYLCGAPIGTAITGPIFTHFDYVGVFCGSVILYILCVAYILIFIKETIVVDLSTKNRRFRSLFDLTNVREAFNTMKKRRDHNGRFHLYLLIVAIAISFLPMYAEYNITYLYTRLKFSWDEVKYLQYSTTSFLISTLGLVVVLPIMTKVLKVKDVIIGILGAIAKLGSEIGIGLSTEGWMLYAVAPALILSRMNSVVVRTIMSKIVTNEEQGKITAIISSADAAMPTFGSLLFNEVYKATIYTFPGTIYIMSAGIAVIPTIVFIWIYVERRILIGKSDSRRHLLPSEEIAPESSDAQMAQTSNMQSSYTHKHVEDPFPDPLPST